MNLAVALYSALLFVILTPGVLLRLPSNGRKLVVAGVHSIVFAIVLYFTAGFIWRWSIGLGFEGFKEGGPKGGSKKASPPPAKASPPPAKASPPPAKASTTFGVKDNTLMKAEKTKWMVDSAAKTTNNLIKK
jgi:hypothetical protein